METKTALVTAGGRWDSKRLAARRADGIGVSHPTNKPMTFKALLAAKTGQTISTRVVEMNGRDLMPGDTSIAPPTSHALD